MDSPTSITDQTPKEKPTVLSSSGSKKPLFKFSFVNPKLLGALAVFVLMVGGIGAGVYLTQNPQQTTSQASITGIDLSFKPETIQTDSDSEFNVDIFANANNNQINSTDLSIKYDPEVLSLKSLTPGQFLPRILIEPIIEEGRASISLGTDGNSGVTGSGVIATLLFKVASSSASPSTEITLDETLTKINVLNRSDDGSGDTLGKAQVLLSSSLSPASESAEPEEPAESAEPAESSISDFNNDGQTNSVDLSIMYTAWGDPKTELQIKADLNKDTKVNGIDYSMFLPQLGR